MAIAQNVTQEYIEYLYKKNTLKSSMFSSCCQLENLFSPSGIFQISWLTHFANDHKYDIFLYEFYLMLLTRFLCLQYF